MARTVSIGAQGYEDMRSNNYFLVDKTAFLADWWRSGDQVTLICRPRRFGKTLTLDTARCFLSLDYAGRGEELFGGLSVWGEADMRALQGTVPVVSLSFARCKAPTAEGTLASMRQVIRVAVEDHAYLAESGAIADGDRDLLARVSDGMDDVTATTCLGRLCSALRRHWGVRPVVLLDEYDTPMQEAWVCGYWDEVGSFARQLFNATFKTNPDLGRALVTGITRVASESIFSDLNNPNVVTVTSPQYEDAFGFTEAEVAGALEEFGMSDRLGEVRSWYDGFTFGEASGIYNPWSITCFLARRRLAPYWADTSSNALVSDLVREAGPLFKEDFETLLAGGSVTKRVDERVHFRRLQRSPDAAWSLLLATGYVRAVGHDELWERLDLSLTNREALRCFDSMIADWFADGGESYNELCRALLADDVDAINRYLGEVTRACASSFDGGEQARGKSAPERFYHGLVLGLLVELRGRYSVESNRESGLGRYDVALVPTDGASGRDPAIVLEFKVFSPRRHGERTLGDTVANALRQIEERRYADGLVERGIARGRIRAYGFAFRGKDVLVGSPE